LKKPVSLPDSLSEQDLPAFDEPWQAQAYAMAQVLIENGLMTPGGWASAFGAAIRSRLASGAEDTTDTYFAAIGDALASELKLDEAELDQIMTDWRNAYETTPHGKPVILADKA
jgi:hypothetical protein